MGHQLHSSIEHINMKAFLTLAAIVAAAQASEWEQFKATHGKLYGSQGEHDARKAIFEDNLKFINKHNAEAATGHHTYTVAINHLADLTNSEITEKLTGSITPLGYNQEAVGAFDANVALPDSVDWRDEGYVTPVKNQGQCGSCWTFSTTGTVEGAVKKSTGKLISLSEQEMVDCASSAGNGCYGGNPYMALLWIIKNGGLEKEEDYPYRARNMQCAFDENKIAATISDAKQIRRGDEQDLQSALASAGPVSVAIDASRQGFHFYHDGVYNDRSCSSYALDHGVLAVGYGTLDGDQYYIVKNSWGTTWGKEGYILMGRNNNNMCGIASMACYAIA